MPKKPETKKAISIPKTKEEKEFERERRRNFIKRTKGITKSDSKRLAMRSGVKRVSEGVLPVIREKAEEFLTGIVEDAVIYSFHAKRITVTTADVKKAFERRGITIYGK